MKKKIIMILLIGLVFGMTSCGNDDFEDTLRSGYEKYQNNEPMSSDEYNAVKSFNNWKSKQTPKTYSEWGD